MFSREQRRAFLFYTLSLLVLIPGVILAIQRCPGGFDWQYTVMSALASRKHNPEGSMWFAGALGLALILLWPAVSFFRARGEPLQLLGKFGIRSLRAGLTCGILLAVERLFIFHLSDVFRKGHEILALLTFLGIYAGVLTLYLHHVSRKTVSLLPALVVALPLVAIGISQLWLYVSQRHLGWVDQDWRQLGVPVWLSFAFWQWLAAAILWAAMGHLVYSSGKRARSP